MEQATIVPRSRKTKRNKQIFKIGQKIFYFYIIYDPFIFAKNRFSKIRSINSDRNGFTCQSWAKMSNFIPLVSD
jgi:hypothetical protein